MITLEIKQLHKYFDKAHVIRGIDLTIEQGEFVVFVGPSGCGKSTLLRLIAGLETVSSGEIKLNGEDITELASSKRDLAMVFQTYALYPHMTVAENMSFALKLAGTDKQEIDQKVQKAADILQLGELLDRKPKTLSGGQRQRVAIGRAIVRQPEVFLFDEPLSNLDAALRVQMRQELAGLHHSLQATMIYVTHDQVEAMTLADKVVILSAGMIEQVGLPLEVYYNPASRFVAEFIGTPKMNFLPVDDTLLSALDSDEVAERLLNSGSWLGVRPESVKLGQGELQGNVQFVEHLGAETLVYLDFHGNQVAARTTRLVSYPVGEKLSFSLDATKAHCFDDEGRRLSKNIHDKNMMEEA